MLCLKDVLFSSSVISCCEITQAWQNKKERKCWRSADLLSANAFEEPSLTLCVLQSFHVLLKRKNGEKKNYFPSPLCMSHSKNVVHIC